MFSSNMFDHLIGVLIIIGLIIGLLIFGIPMYFVGRHYGKQQIYNEAQSQKVLDIRYNPIDGEKLYIWKK